MNKCTFMGRVSSEITVYQKEDTISIRFNMALNVYNAKEKKNESEFIRCVAFGKNAENINKFFHKGSPILIESHVSNGSYKKDGVILQTLWSIILNSRHRINLRIASLRANLPQLLLLRLQAHQLRHHLPRHRQCPMTDL